MIVELEVCKLDVNDVVVTSPPTCLEYNDLPCLDN